MNNRRDEHGWMHRKRRHLAALAAVIAVVSGITWTGMPVTRVHAASAITGLHVVGNQIQNGTGQTVRLLGVDRSGSEYACIQGWGFFDGPSDAASVQAMASWHVNAVRIPLNEDCWLGINGSPAAYSGSNYQNAIANYVNLLNQNGMAAILDLQWVAPGTSQATGQTPMPDQDHAPSFWQSVAGYFKGNSSVLFDLFNEPYPDNNSDSTAAWSCLRNGGTCPGVSYQAAGTQQLVNTVRGTGATNIIMVPGVGYTGLIDQWLTYKPSDPQNNLAASWHAYNFSWCTAQSCWDSQVAPVAASVPLVTGEIGENDCAHGYIDSLMSWLDSHGASYLAWAWDTNDCSGFPSLVSNYNGTPTNFGVGVKNHLAAVSGNPPPATSTPAPPTSTAKPTSTSVSGTGTSTPVPATGTPPSELVTIPSASASPSSVAPGGIVNFSASIRSTAPLSGAIVDFEVYNSSNTKVYQTYQNATLNGGSQTFTASWPVSSGQAAGNYTLMVGVFGPNWTPNYAWNNSAASISVGSASATNTPVLPTRTPVPVTNTPVPTSTPTKTSTPPSATTRLGLTTVGSSRDLGDDNSLTAAKVTTGSVAEIVKSLSVYMGAINAAPYNQYSLAVYADNGGKPGSVVARSGTGSLVANSWNTIAVSASLAPTTTYWLVYNTNGSMNNVYLNTVSSYLGGWSAAAVPFGNWPTAFGSSVLDTAQYSIYATVSP